MSVAALGTARVWKISEAVAAREQSGTLPVNDIVLMAVNQELRQSMQILEMNRGPADSRLARFLVQYGEKQTLRGCKQQDFLLPFGRRDLAHCLGVATETLSRGFSRLQARHILSVDNHHIIILDIEALRRIAYGNA